MNTIHDMGGMAGLGELVYEGEEAYGYHYEWEGRVHAIVSALNLFRRTELESIPADEYLRMSYYERWIIMMENLLVMRGLATREEIETGEPAAGSARTPELTPAEAVRRMFVTSQSERDIDVAPRFAVGDSVRGRNINPETHTRMPRYTRGRVGVVERDRGIFDLPDNTEIGLEPKPQHVYLVRFSAQELWGDDKPAQDSLYIDMWEDYLEPA